MAKLLPFRQIDEIDVVNLFAFDGSAATRGLLVKLDTSATWKSDNEFETTAINNSYANTVSDRYSVSARVSTCTSGDKPLGMLMYDVAETDENGEKLIWHPRKAHEMQVSLSGQAVPVVTKGIVLVEVAAGEDTLLAITPGVTGYAGDAGALVTAATANADQQPVGIFLGPKDANDRALFKLNVDLK
ncbi:hypothetical protein CL634_03815 [bacterium]|nr:hypothetical protein [bacterium]